MTLRLTSSLLAILVVASCSTNSSEQEAINAHEPSASAVSPDAEYGDVESLLQAARTAGLTCDSAEPGENIDAIESVRCDTGELLAIYHNKGYARSYLSDLDGLDEALLGPNWTVVGSNVTQLQTSLGGELVKRTRIETALRACDGTSSGIEVLDEGRSLSLQSYGQELLEGASLDKIRCILDEVGMTEATWSRMLATRALDGTQSAEWNDFSMVWTYHPDSGLHIILEDFGD